MLSHQHCEEQFDLEAFLEVPQNEVQEEIAPNTQMPRKKVGKGKSKGESKKRGEQSKIEGKKIGHWSIQENKKYHWFLEIYHNHFLNKHLRRVERIFKIMEIFLGTREAEQCRSHHQKMEKRHGNFRNILIHLRKQHYGSEDTEPVFDDIQLNSIEITDGLVSLQELYKEENEEHKKEDEMESIRCEQQIKGMQEEGKFMENILEDGYSNCIDLHGFFS